MEQQQGNTPTNPAALRANVGAREAALPAVQMGFGNLQSFELIQRAAKVLAHSTLVPTAYRMQKEVKEYGKVVAYEDNPSAIPNCIVALNMAQRMGADPLMVMQNLYIVEGRPSWSSQYIIAAINSCGRYSPLRFEMSAVGEPRDVEYTTTEWVQVQGEKKKQPQERKKSVTITPRTCVAWATELATGDRLESPPVSMDMAVAEGWFQKNGSKWQTMPDVMLRYRAAAFFGKLYAPELLMGLQTAEEAHDIIDVERQPEGHYAAAPATVESLREQPAEQAQRRRATDAEDAEVIEQRAEETAPPAESAAPQAQPDAPAASEEPASDAPPADAAAQPSPARVAINAALDAARAKKNDDAVAAALGTAPQARTRRAAPTAE
jgi:hypothetical protein